MPNNFTFGSRSAGTNRTMIVTVVNADANTSRKTSITNIITVRRGLLARTVSEGYNVFRAWNDDVWIENVTSSDRFNLETDGMTEDEKTIFINEKKAELRKKGVS